MNDELRAAAGAEAPEATDVAIDSDTRGLAVGAIASGWFLFLIVGPLAVFLTWFGDCARDPCPVASDIDRAIYTADLVAWLVLPGLAFLAYRGWRPASVVIATFGAFVVAQGLASIVGGRGFQAFFLVFPAGGLLAIGGVLGVLGPRIRASAPATRPRRRPPPRPRPRGRGPA